MGRVTIDGLTNYEKAKRDFKKKGSVMIADYGNAGSIKGTVCRLRKEGFKTHKIRSKGKVIGYRLAGQ